MIKSWRPSTAPTLDALISNSIPWVWLYEALIALDRGQKQTDRGTKRLSYEMKSGIVKIKNPLAPWRRPAVWINMNLYVAFECFILPTSREEATETLYVRDQVSFSLASLPSWVIVVCGRSFSDSTWVALCCQHLDFPLLQSC